MKATKTTCSIQGNLPYESIQSNYTTSKATCHMKAFKATTPHLRQLTILKYIKQFTVSMETIAPKTTSYMKVSKATHHKAFNATTPHPKHSQQPIATKETTVSKATHNMKASKATCIKRNCTAPKETCHICEPGYTRVTEINM